MSNESLYVRQMLFLFALGIAGAWISLEFIDQLFGVNDMPSLVRGIFKIMIGWGIGVLSGHGLIVFLGGRVIKLGEVQ